MSATSDKISGGVQTVYRILKTIAVWGVIALGGYLLFPIVSNYLSSLQVMAAIVVLNAVATITLWREAARKPPRPKKEFLQKLMRSAPITPMQYGDEGKLIDQSCPIIEQLFCWVNGKSFSIENSRRIDDENAKALWHACKFQNIT